MTHQEITSPPTFCKLWYRKLFRNANFHPKDPRPVSSRTVLIKRDHRFKPERLNVGDVFGRKYDEICIVRKGQSRVMKPGLILNYGPGPKLAGSTITSEISGAAFNIGRLHCSQPDSEVMNFPDTMAMGDLLLFISDRLTFKNSKTATALVNRKLNFIKNKKFICENLRHIYCQLMQVLYKVYINWIL